MLLILVMHAFIYKLQNSIVASQDTETPCDSVTMVCNSVSAPVGISVRSAGMCGGGDAVAGGEVTAAPSC